MIIRRLAGVSWVSLILVFYYRRAWRLLAAGPAAWDIHGFLNGGWRPPWPFAAEAAWRGLQGLVGVVVILAAAWVMGWLALRLLRCDGHDLVEGELYRLAAGLGVLAYLSLGLASIGLYRPVIIAPTVVALGVAAVPLAWWRRSTGDHDRPGGRRSSESAECGPQFSGSAGCGPRSSESAECGPRSRKAQGAALDLRKAHGFSRALLLLSALSVTIAFVGALAPETEYDALWYHLWLPRLWLERGHGVDVLSEYVSLYPLTWELLYGDAMTIGGAVAAKLLHFACLPLLAAATWQLARRFFGEVSPWLAAAVMLTTPTLLWEATTAYNDLALTLYVTLGVYALLMHVNERKRGDGPARNAGWFRLAAMCFGLATAIKHLGLVVTALVAAGLVARELGRVTRGRSGSFALRLTSTLREPLALGLVAVALTFPWYWRAWAASGNPFFPELHSVFGARPPQRWDAVTEAAMAGFKAHFGFPRSLRTIVLLPWNLTQHGASFGGSIGPLFLLAAPWVIGRVPRGEPARWLIYLVVSYVAVWASPVSSFQLRFLLPIVPAMSVLAAVGLTRLTAAATPRAARTGVTCVAALLFLNLPPFTPLHEGDRERWNGWLTHVVRTFPVGVLVGRETQEAYLRREVATYGAWRHLEAATPPRGTRVLEAGGGDNLYAARQRIPIDATLSRGGWAQGSGAEATVLATLARLGITPCALRQGLVGEDDQRASCARLAVVPSRLPGTGVPRIRARWFTGWRRRGRARRSEASGRIDAGPRADGDAGESRRREPRERATRAP